MTRLETMGIDPTTKKGLIKLLETCPKKLKAYYRCPTKLNGEVKECAECVANYLLSEVSTKKVKRWETYEGDFLKAHREWDDENNDGCMGDCIISFAKWLMEDVEVAV